MTRRIRRHEEHTNHEAWAIPYGDLVTLLLAFFVVMYAISSVNAGKYRVLSDSLFAAFRGTPRTMEPIQVGDKQSGSGADLQSLIVQSQLQGQQRSSLAPVPMGGGNQSRGLSPVGTRQQGQAAAQGNGSADPVGNAAATALSRVADEVARAMDDLVKQNLVVVRHTEFWIEVEIKTDILFPSGSAQLAPYAVDVIQRLAGALAPFPNPIRVEGHTDNKPISTVAFYSNWELSAARAGSVVRVLQGRGVAPDRLAVIGYGDQRPIQSNDTEPGRNANRRVVVVILSTQLQPRKDPTDQTGGQTPGAPPAADPAAVSASATTAAAQPVSNTGTSNTSASSTATSPGPQPAQGALVSPGEPAELPSAVRAPVPPPASSPGATLSTSSAHAAGNGMVPAP
jgi:chemotaxis protein MotB